MYLLLDPSDPSLPSLAGDGFGHMQKSHKRNKDFN
jgi:hypothetical protein